MAVRKTIATDSYKKIPKASNIHLDVSWSRLDAVTAFILRMITAVTIEAQDDLKDQDNPRSTATNGGLMTVGTDTIADS